MFGFFGLGWGVTHAPQKVKYTIGKGSAYQKFTCMLDCFGRALVHPYYVNLGYRQQVITTD